MITLDAQAPNWAHQLVVRINQLFGGIRPDNAVKITGGTIDGTTVGATTKASGAFTTLSASSVATLQGGASLLSTTAALTSFSSTQVGTLNNAPRAGDPAKWVAINDGGTTRYIPVW